MINSPNAQENNTSAKVIWITGLSGSGKTTIGSAVHAELKKVHSNVVFLDGDMFRQVCDNDLGYTKEDRLANARRISKMCNLLVSQNIYVVCSTISLFKEIHEYNRKHISEYIEVFIDCSIQELQKRDQKGLYSGLSDNLIGVNLDYDKPENCDLTIDNSEKNNLELKVEKVMALVKETTNA